MVKKPTYEELEQRVKELEKEAVDRKRAEEAVRESEEKYKTLIESSLTGIFIHQDGKYVFVNDRFAEIHGYEPEELLGKEYLTLIHPDERAISEDVASKRLKGEAVLKRYEIRRLGKNGKSIWCEMMAERIEYEGRPAIMGNIIDITERKAAEEALRDSEERYRTVLEGCPDPVVVYDVEGKGDYINPAFTRVFGWLPEELVGKKLDYVPDENWPETQMMIEKVQAGESFSRVESRRYAKDGSILEVSISAAIHLNRHGIPVGSVHILRDIGDRKRTEEALQRAHDELELRVEERTAELRAAHEELSQCAYAASHDLKAPLRTIHHYSDFLGEELEATLNEDQKAYLDNINRIVRQAEELIDALLAFIRASTYSGPVETIDIGALLKKLTASLNLPPDVEVVLGNKWPTIKAEPTLVSEIFLHLIRNAVTFNRSPRKRVEIGWRQVDGGSYQLFVRDNGIGIEPRYHEKIFGVFQRLHAREEYEGTGIGLAICKKIVERHGGRIWVDSEPAKGSTFYFTIHSVA